MRQSFFYGAVILIAAGAVTRILGFANRIVLSRVIGAEGMGLYQMVVPLLYFMITLTTFGLPVAIAKQVAESEAAGDSNKSRRYLVLSLVTTIAFSIAITLILLFTANWVTGFMFADKRAYLVLLAALPVVMIASVSAVLRGYFQGKQNMVPTAVSQLVEQTVRLLFVGVVTAAFLGKGVEYAAAGAVLSILFGEGAGLLYMLWQTKRATVKTTEKLLKMPIFTALSQNKQSFHELFHVSLPVTMSRIVGSIAYVLEPMLVPFALIYSGTTTAQATGLYGQFAGMAVPLLLFPTFLTYSLSISLMPAVAEAAYQKKAPLVHRRIYQAMRISLVIGAPFTVLLYVFAEPLCSLLYGHPDVGILLRQMAPFSVFLFFQAPLASALQGLDHANVVFRNTLIGAIVKTAAMVLLTMQPSFGIHGTVISLNLSITLVTMLHFASLMKGIGFTIQVTEFLKIGAAMVAMGYASSYMASHWLTHLPLGKILLTSSICGSLLYVGLLVAMRILGKQDVKRIPWIGDQLAIFFPRR